MNGGWAFFTSCIFGKHRVKSIRKVFALSPMKKSDIIQRTEAFRKYNLWESRHPMALGAEKAIEAVGAIYDLIPPEFRRKEVDITGLRLMRLGFRHLKGAR
jgi:hypothetical protein